MLSFHEKANLVVRNLEKEIGKDQFDVSIYLFACTLEMVCGMYAFVLCTKSILYEQLFTTATSLGYDIGVQSGRNQDYLEAVEKYAFYQIYFIIK